MLTFIDILNNIYSGGIIYFFLSSILEDWGYKKNKNIIEQFYTYIIDKNNKKNNRKIQSMIYSVVLTTFILIWPIVIILMIIINYSNKNNTYSNNSNKNTLKRN